MDIGAWLGALIGAAVAVAAVTVGLGVVLGVALASYGRLPVVLAVAVAVLVPVLGPLVLVVVAAVREARRAHRDGRPITGVFGWSIRALSRRSRALIVFAPVLAVIGLLLLLVVPVVRLHPTTLVPVTVSLAEVPGGLAAVLLSALTAALAGLLAARRPTRLGAIVGASVGAAWSAPSAALLVLSAPVLEVLAQVGSVSGSAVGRLVLAWLRTVAPSVGDPMSAADEALTAQLGPGLWFALVSGLLLEGWALVEVQLARRVATVVLLPEQSAAPWSTPAPPAADEQGYTW